MLEERKVQIRQKFARAATTYDSHAVVQFQVAQELAALLPADRQVSTILEIGCGTGRFTALLQEHFPGAQLTALDFAPEMVAQASQKLVEPVTLLCADGEEYLHDCQLCFDLITSNATMQWFNDLEASLAHVQRCLTPGGQALFSLFGPGSLHCLADALGEVLGVEIMLPTQSFSHGDVVQGLAGPLFASVDVQRLVKKQRYSSFYELLVAIKTTGTGGYHHGLPRFTRRRLAALDAWFAKRGGLEVEYEIFLCRCQRGSSL